MTADPIASEGFAAFVIRVGLRLIEIPIPNHSIQNFRLGFLATCDYTSNRLRWSRFSHFSIQGLQRRQGQLWLLRASTLSPLNTVWPVPRMPARTWSKGNRSAAVAREAVSPSERNKRYTPIPF